MAVSGGPPGDIARLFAQERSHLLELLNGLKPSDWSMPTPCPQWTVLQLSCHLVGDDLGVLARHRDHHLGTVPPEGSDESTFIAWLDDLQMEWVHAVRRLSPRLVIELLGWSGPQVVDLFQSQDPLALGGQVSWAGPEPVPLWLDQVRELSEFWIHRQQLLSALGRPPDLRPELVRPILEGLRWSYPFRLGSVMAAPGDTVSIEVSGPVTVAWHLVSTAAGWEFRTRAGARQVARLAMSTDEAWRLLTNNLPGPEVERLELSGDEAILGVLRRTRSIIGTPS
jgi:uncharacterized protein (TIGR03083 family)